MPKFTLPSLHFWMTWLGVIPPVKHKLLYVDTGFITPFTYYVLWLIICLGFFKHSPGFEFPLWKNIFIHGSYKFPALLPLPSHFLPIFTTQLLLQLQQSICSSWHLPGAPHCLCTCCFHSLHAAAQINLWHVSHFSHYSSSAISPERPPLTVTYWAAVPSLSSSLSFLFSL